MADMYRAMPILPGRQAGGPSATHPTKPSTAAVAHRLEQIPKLFMELGQLADFFPNVMDDPREVRQVIVCQSAVGNQGAIQLTQKTFVVDDQAKLFLLLCVAVFIKTVPVSSLETTMRISGSPDP